MRSALVRADSDEKSMQRIGELLAVDYSTKDDGFERSPARSDRCWFDGRTRPSRESGSKSVFSPGGVSRGASLGGQCGLDAASRRDSAHQYGFDRRQ